MGQNRRPKANEHSVNMVDIVTAVNGQARVSTGVGTAKLSVGLLSMLVRSNEHPERALQLQKTAIGHVGRPDGRGQTIFGHVEVFAARLVEVLRACKYRSFCGKCR